MLYMLLNNSKIDINTFIVYVPSIRKATGKTSVPNSYPKRKKNCPAYINVNFVSLFKE